MAVQVIFGGRRAERLSIATALDLLAVTGRFLSYKTDALVMGSWCITLGINPFEKASVNDSLTAMKLIRDDYPIVLLPDVIQSLARDSWLFCGENINLPPVPPQVPWALKMGEKLKTLWHHSHLFKSGLIILMALLGFGLGKLRQLGLLFPTSIALVLIAVGALLLVWGLREPWIETQKFYRQRLRTYNQQMRQYQSQSFWRSPRQLRNKKGARLEALKQALKGKVQLPKTRRSTQALGAVGVLYEYLQAAFGEVHFAQELEISGQEASYSIDLTVVEKGCLYLDIEIDQEQYQLEELYRERDRFFLERGWIVIRFAHEQVVSHPQSCCQVIAQVLTRLTGERPDVGKFNQKSLQ